MNTAKTLIVFGGADTEEQAARAVAHKAGLVIATAATADGKKVHGGNAYQATSFVIDEGNIKGVTQVIIFECTPVVAGELEIIARCDHHSPGDAGWGKGADQFWEASSLGQLCSLFGIEPNNEHLLVAAGDHCPADAYAGRCKGVNPAEFAEFRIAGKVAFYATNPKTVDKADAGKIRASIAVAKEKLVSAPQADGVCDLRDAGLIDELPEAALSCGFAYISEIPDTDRDRNPTGNLKIVLGGHTTPKTVTQFLDWARTLSNRVGEPYGNPIRGFAGVVVTPQKAVTCPHCGQEDCAYLAGVSPICEPYK